MYPRSITSTYITGLTFSRFNFVFYSPDNIYLQYDLIPALDPENDLAVKTVLNALQQNFPHFNITEITSERSLTQVAVGTIMSLEMLKTFGYPVSDES